MLGQHRHDVAYDACSVGEGRITARRIKVFELALVKKEAFHGAKKLKMAPANKERRFFHYYIKIFTNDLSSLLKVGISVT